jgi:hypothetical protein
MEYGISSQFQNMVGVTKSFDYIQTVLLKSARASMKNKCQYVDSLRILVSPIKEVKYNGMALMKTKND